MSRINQKDARDARLMLLRQVIILPMRFLRSLIIIPILPQSTIFLLKVISTWFGYLPRLLLGTNAILGFYYPAAEAKGDLDEQQRYVTLCWQFTLFAAVTGGIAGIAMAVFYVSPAYIPFLLIWGLSIAPTTYVKSFFQAKGDFDKIAILDIITAVSNFIFPLAGWFLFELMGYIGGTVIAFLITLYVGRKEIFPKVTKITRDFAKNAIGNGIHFWLNGFLSDLAKSFEVTLFVILAGISEDFGGQYAVGMTLAAILSQLMTSFSNVFQRKAVTQISENKDEGYKYLMDYIALDIVLFTIFFVGFIPGLYIIAYLLPNYASLIQIVPFLLFGVFFMRLRFYPGVAYKTERRFWEIHSGHIIQLVLGIGIVLLIYYFTDLPHYYMAASQFLGSMFGAIILFFLFFYRNGVTYTQSDKLNLTLFLGLLIVALAGVYLISNFWWLMLLELVLCSLILVGTLKAFPHTYSLIKQLLDIPFLRRFRRR